MKAIIDKKNILISCLVSNKFQILGLLELEMNERYMFGDSDIDDCFRMEC